MRLKTRAYGYYKGTKSCVDTDTIDDPDNELGTVKSSLKIAGIETIIAARVGTDQVNDNLKDYANIDSN